MKGRKLANENTKQKGKGKGMPNVKSWGGRLKGTDKQ